MILVTGATGNVGRALLQELFELGVAARALVRDRSRALNLPRGVDVVVGDWRDRDSLEGAFDGIERAFLLLPEIAVEPTSFAIELARSVGATQLVLLSSYAALGTPTPAMGVWHRAREEMIRDSGIPATTLRPTGFMTNALDWATSIQADGYVLNPIGSGKQAPIDPRDIASVATRALTAEPEDWRELVLTGGEALTMDEQVGVLAEALGRTIDVRPASSAEEVVRSRFPNGAPKPLADAIVDGFERMRADTVGLRTQTVREQLGRDPRTFRAWCAENVEAFR
jgi:uncharacterized protein YbjT (DUF2867 family)